MENGFIILGIAIILVVICGCTQSPAPVQQTATFTTQTSAIPPSTSTTYPPIQTTNLVSENTVRINDFAFEPATITVKAGSIVRWVNLDAVPHRIQFEDEHFSSILLASSQSGSQKFNEPGVYPYICLIHPDMHGTVIVE